MRKKPINAEWYDWDAFCNWADNEGIGESKDDWIPWWDCWKKAFSCAMNKE